MPADSFSPSPRPLMDCGDYRLFDTAEGIEVLVYGDDDRLAIAQRLSTDIDALCIQGLHYSSLWFRFAGQFIPECLTMNATPIRGIDSCCDAHLIPVQSHSSRILHTPTLTLVSGFLIRLQATSFLGA